MVQITVTPVTSKAERAEFVDFVYTSNANDPNFVPQLRAEELEKYTPGGNPYFEHARWQLYVARNPPGKVRGADRCPHRRTRRRSARRARHGPRLRLLGRAGSR